MALAYFARVDHLATRQKDELVKHGNNVASWLVDSENHGAVVVFGERDERFDNVEGVVGV